MNKNVLIVGDLIEDHFTYGKAIGISAETPTVVAEEENCNVMYGGAGLVMRHLHNLNMASVLITFGGDEFYHSNNIICLNPDLEIYDKFIKEALDDGKEYDECDDFAFSKMETIRKKYPDIEKWIVSKKKRYFVDSYKMIQYDNINKARHCLETEKLLIEKIENWIDKYKPLFVVSADNRHGVISENIARWLSNNQKKYGYGLYVDSQYSQTKPNHSWYAGSNTLFMNEKEVNYWKNEFRDIQVMSEYWNCNIVHKIGEDGVEAFINGISYKIAAPYVDVVDTCGAGDAFLASYVASDKKNVEERLVDAVNYASLSCTWKGTEVHNVP